MKYLKIFTDFLEVVEPLSDDERGRLFMAMLGYALDGSQPTLTGNERFVWAMARQHIDREAAAYESMVEARREAGRRGADARWQKMAKHGKNGQDKDKEKDKDKDKDKDKEREYTPAAKAARPRAMPPSLEEIESYCRQRGNQVNARRFLDFYTANGWKVGRNPMKDWKAAVRSWESNGIGDRPAAPGPELSDKEVFRQAIELHRMKEAKQI